MKKIFTIALAVLAAASLSAAQRVVWTGDEPISWNQEAYAGTQFVTPAGILSDLYKGDTILVSYVDKIENPQHVLTYQAGSGWDWTDLVISADDGVISYVVESDQIATEIGERGLIFRGQGYNITSITIAELNDNPDWTETTVWTAADPVAISWDPEKWAGSYLDTYAISQTLFSTIKKGYVIRVHISSVTSESQFQISYKTGEKWAWTSYSYSLGRQMINIPVESSDDAVLIAERGIIISGYKYYVNSIGIYAPKGGTVAIDNTNADTKAVKFFKNGQLYILRDNQTYTLQGQLVK